MSAPTIARCSVQAGVVAALAASASGAALVAALAPLAGFDAALRAAVALVSAGYALYLLAQSTERVGRATTATVWLALSAGAWLIGIPLPGFVLLHVTMLWLVRSLYRYSGVLPALADLALTALSLAFAAWAAARSGSPFLALWCFFLAQALTAYVPSTIAPHAAEREASAPPDGGDAFERARRTADQALRRLAAGR